MPRGGSRLAVPADIAEQINSQAYTLEVTVTDVNEQEVSNRTQAVVHKGLFYVGLASAALRGHGGRRTDRRRQGGRPGAGRRSPDQEVEVVFMKRRWYSAQKEGADGRWYWEWEVEDTPVYTTTVQTDGEGNAEAAFVPEEGGSYKVRAIGPRRARATRSARRPISGSAAAEWISWRRENNDRIELIADKDEYQVGDTAEILVPSPFRGPVKALLTIERGEILEYRVLTLEGNSEITQRADRRGPRAQRLRLGRAGQGHGREQPALRRSRWATSPCRSPSRNQDAQRDPDARSATWRRDEHYGPRDTVQLRGAGHRSHRAGRRDRAVARPGRPERAGPDGRRPRRSR